MNVFNLNYEIDISIFHDPTILLLIFEIGVVPFI